MEESPAERFAFGSLPTTVRALFRLPFSSSSSFLSSRALRSFSRAIFRMDDSRSFATSLHGFTTSCLPARVRSSSFLSRNGERFIVVASGSVFRSRSIRGTNVPGRMRRVRGKTASSMRHPPTKQVARVFPFPFFFYASW